MEKELSIVNDYFVVAPFVKKVFMASVFIVASASTNVMASEKDHNHESMSEQAMTSHDMKNMESMQGMSVMPATKKMKMGSPQGGPVPENARDPHAFSGGYDLKSLDADGFRRPVLADEYSFYSILVDKFEGVSTSANKSATYDLQFWYGRDYDRLVIKAEGDFDNNAGKKSIEESSTELLWSHALATFWNSQLGVRYDTAEDENRKWLAFGVQGLAPYWFELDLTAYAGEQGQTAFNVVAEYEVLITQKLIIQPSVEIDFYGKDDKAVGVGSGLSSMATAIRLRYEIRREFAPYIGIEQVTAFGNTKDFLMASNSETSEVRTVVGVRFWY